MFAYNEPHSAYMDRFFEENPHPAISWIDDIGKGRYGPAANALLAEAEQASNLEAKHVMHPSCLENVPPTETDYFSSCSALESSLILLNSTKRMRHWMIPFLMVCSCIQL